MRQCGRVRGDQTTIRTGAGARSAWRSARSEASLSCSRSTRSRCAWEFDPSLGDYKITRFFRWLDYTGTRIVNFTGDSALRAFDYRLYSTRTSSMRVTTPTNARARVLRVVRFGDLPDGLSLYNRDRDRHGVNDRRSSVSYDVRRPLGFLGESLVQGWSGGFY